LKNGGSFAPFGKLKLPMNKRILLAALSLISLPAFAIDITVDNNPGAVADFSSLQDAINASNEGDRIIIAGSPTNYGTSALYVANGDGSFTMKNNLTIVGVGYLRDANSVPANASGINAAAAFGLTLGATTGNRNLNGLTVIGCDITPNLAGNNSNLLFDRCYVRGFQYLGNETNANFTRCYFVNALALRDSSNCSVTSSIIGGLILEDSSVASHCVIRGDSLVTVEGIVVVDATSSLSNCIIDARSTQAQTYPPVFNGSCTHTIGIGNAQLPTGGGNLDNQAIADVVLDAGSLDAKWALAVGSPAKDAASDTTDIGAFGSASPYLLSGLTGAPTITRFLVPAIASPTTGLSVEVDIEQPSN